jgi:fructose-specific phosphotransferase system IIA component
MDLSNITDKNCILIGLKSADKKGVIGEMAGLLEKANKINDIKTTIISIMNREEMGSTGLEKGVAVPHAKTDTVDNLVMAVGISKKGIDFNAIDGKLSYIFFMLLTPPDSTGPHIEALAEIAKFIIPAKRRERLKNSGNPKEIMDIIREYEKTG